MIISEVSKEFAISANTLRYYERIGMIPSVNRLSNGIQAFNEEDRRWVRFAKCMRNDGVQIEAIVEYIVLFMQGDTTSEARKQILIEQSEKNNSALSHLNEKIANYDKLKMPEKKIKVVFN